MEWLLACDGVVLHGIANQRLHSECRQSPIVVFGVNVKSILAMASIGGIIVGFAMQTIIKDILYGTLILAEGSIGVGDFVRINDMDGVIDSVSLRTTVIRNFNGAFCGPRRSLLRSENGRRAVAERSVCGVNGRLISGNDNHGKVLRCSL